MARYQLPAPQSMYRDTGAVEISQLFRQRYVENMAGDDVNVTCVAREWPFFPLDHADITWAAPVRRSANRWVWRAGNSAGVKQMDSKKIIFIGPNLGQPETGVYCH